MSNYRRGYQIERKIVKEFEDQGFWATRTPASKGLFDVIGVGWENVFLIQAKRTKRKTIPPSLYGDDIKEIQKWIKSFPCPLPRWLHTHLWVWQDRKGWVKFNVTKDSVEMWRR